MRCHRIVLRYGQLCDDCRPVWHAEIYVGCNPHSREPIKTVTSVFGTRWGTKHKAQRWVRRKTSTKPERTFESP